MAFNNSYQYYPMANYQQLMPQTPNYQNGIIWVQGEAGAKSYLVAPNTTVALWDSEDKVIYLKSSDASGMPSIKTLDYTIRENGSTTPNFVPNSDFITKDDISRIESRLDAVEDKLESFNKSTARKKEVKDE